MFRKRVYGGTYYGSYPKRQRYVPYGNNIRKNFSTVNRRTTAGPKTSGTVLQQLRSLQKVVKNLAPEIKYHDNAISISNVTASGSVTHITAISQGDTQATRTGNTVNVTSVSCRGAFGYASDVPGLSGFVRFLIVEDKEQVGDAAPTAAEIVTDGSFTANPVTALPNLANLERFRVLYMSPAKNLKQLSLDTDTTFPPTSPANFEYNWKGNIKVSFNGTAGTDIEKNGIYFVLLADSATETLDWSGVARIGFTDV